MDKLILIFLFIIVFFSCAWRDMDNSLFAGYVLFSTIDTIQTAQPNFQEANPLFRQLDGTPNMGLVISVKLVTTLLLYVVADKYPSWRTKILTTALVLQGGTVVWNAYQW